MARKRAAAALVFVLCFLLAFTTPVYAADKGRSNHIDTLDYCMRASDVNVKLSELQGLDDSQKQALVESTSGYAFYEWIAAYFIRGDLVSGSGDFGSVDWSRAGSYKITVKLPSVTPGVTSEISYTLKIIDDHPAEPDPKPPAMYRVTVRFLEENTGLSLKDDYVSEEMEEGSSFTIREDILTPPEDYEVVEIQGDTAGQISADREVIVVCRKIKHESDDPTPEDPDKPPVNPDDPKPEDPDKPPVNPDDPTPEDPDKPPVNPDDPTPEDPDKPPVNPDDPTPEDPDKPPVNPDDPTPPGPDNPPVNPDDPTPEDPDKPPVEPVDPSPTDPKEQDDQKGGNSQDSSGKNKGNSGKSSGKASGKGSGSGSGKSSGRPGSSSPSGNTAGGQAAEAPSAAVSQTVAAAENYSNNLTDELPVEQIVPAEEAVIPEETVPEDIPEAGAAGTSMALAGQEDGSNESSLGGAILPQPDVQKEKYPLWSVTATVTEAGILAVLAAMILSDLRVILWFEEKKKR